MRWRQWSRNLGISELRTEARFTTSAVASSLIVALAIAAIGVPRAAAEELDEVLIGTFKVRPYAQDTAPAPDLPSTQPAGAAPADIAAPPVHPTALPPAGSTATDQLGAALALFAAGDRSGGQRALEVLVAAWPAAPEANHARKALADLYRQAATTSPPAAVTAPVPTSVTASPPPATPATSDVAQPVGGSWLTEVRRDGGLDRRFILEVGDRLFFGLGSAELGARARNVLAAQARWLGERPEVYAIIEGHADDPGADAANVTLSQQRADAVRDRLIEEGVGPDRLKAVAFGRSQRLAECEEAECAAQNRRVVTAIYTRDGTGPAPPASPLSALPPGAGKAASQTAAVRPSDPSATLLATVAPALRPRR